MPRFLAFVFAMALWQHSLLTPAAARDVFLVIGGGYAPMGNQASLERNVLLFRRVLSDKRYNADVASVFFADGEDPKRDLQIMNRDMVPKANRLMAEFFGSEDNLGLSYRNHEVPRIAGASTPENIRRWFSEEGPKMNAGDRLILYVTSHGQESQDRDDPFNTSISLWNYSKITVRDLVGMLKQLPEGVSIVTIMVQCHAGGFSRLIYDDANPDNEVASQIRCGFFATVYDRPAAGCTPDIDEASYVEYSTYFWEAIRGQTSTGEPIEVPDYNVDGRVSFAEAHAYTVLRSDTIDLPVKTSDQFLKRHIKFEEDGPADLLPRDLPYSQIFELATADEKAMLEGLSKQLNLEGEDRLSQAERLRNEARPRDRSRFRGRPGDSSSRLKRMIASSLQNRWPELGNLMNPLAIELVTSRADEFIREVESHQDYQRYRELVESRKRELNDQEKRVKFERFILVAETPVRRENMRKIQSKDWIDRYEAIRAAEEGSIGGD